jgi:hypothetical protein
MALPETVWEDHLLPLLTCKDAARLACTCRALRGVVREHFGGRLDGFSIEKLRAALTTFPRARSVATYPTHLEKWDAAQSKALVKWLRDGGHGNHITTITTWPGSDTVDSTVHAALRRGALPSLMGVAANLAYKTHRASLTDGRLNAMHELRLKVEWNYELESQFAALRLVRQLPALAELELEVKFAGDDEDDEDDDPVEWPPFIPPSLKTLVITSRDGPVILESLLCALPGMLGASGARLDRLEVTLPSDFEAIGDGLVHLAQALRCCSPTLKRFLMSTGDHGCIRIDKEASDYESQVERLRLQWADVLAGVSACRELQELVLPLCIRVDPMFPPGTAFARLTHLDIREISDYEREHPPDADVMGLWELMAAGGLPALTKLSVRLEGRAWGDVEEVRTRVVPAFEAVAGTLTHLHLSVWVGRRCWSSDEVRVGYELGVAVGKLRRLKDLALSLFLSADGRAYHALAQGLAASGGACPLPLLWRLHVVFPVMTNADLLASLLLPSVRVFGSSHPESGSSHRAALLTACALRQAGYKHTWAVWCPGEAQEAVQAIAECRLGDLGGQEQPFLT